MMIDGSTKKLITDLNVFKNKLCGNTFVKVLFFLFVQWKFSTINAIYLAVILKYKIISLIFQLFIKKIN